MWGLSSLSRGRTHTISSESPEPSQQDLKGRWSSTFCHVFPGVSPFIPSLAASGPRALEHQLWTPVISRDQGCCWWMGCIRKGHVLTPPPTCTIGPSVAAVASASPSQSPMASPEGQQRQQGQQRWREPACPGTTAFWYVRGCVLLAAGHVLSEQGQSCLEPRTEEQGCLLTGD